MLIFRELLECQILLKITKTYSKCTICTTTYFQGQTTTLKNWFAEIAAVLPTWKHVRHAFLFYFHLMRRCLKYLSITNEIMDMCLFHVHFDLMSWLIHNLSTKYNRNKMIGNNFLVQLYMPNFLNVNYYR